MGLKGSVGAARARAAQPAIEIALCVITFRRPVGLRRCLEGLADLSLPHDPAVDLRVIVVDNAADAPARLVVERASATFPWRLDYLVEPERGIPHARNHAVAFAVEGGADLIGFVDDDEVTEPDWLVEMMKVWAATGADVLVGPSVPRFETPVPRWVIDGEFFERRRFTSGEAFPFNYARTSGVLINTAALPPGPVFDTRFRYSGGSDRHLFARLQRAGRTFAWVDDAVVAELVPPTRTTVRWLMRRSFRIGNADSWMLVLDGASRARRLRRLAGGALTSAVGVLAFLVALPRGRVASVRALRTVARGAGLVAGALGVPYREYLRIHGG